jgi:hypothetical protein
MFKIIGIAVVVVIAAILIYAATKPDTMRYERKIAIKAPPDKILAFINDFHRWSAWSPYEKKDASMKRTFSGAPNGKGSVYEWDGNKEVGQGRMEIAEVSPSKTLINLDFLKPFEAHNFAEFTAVPKGDITEVTWAMYGPAPYLSRLMCLFVNMDNMVGKDFDAGLAALKNAAEKS